MTSTLVDSNVLIDLIDGKGLMDWSSKRFIEAGETGAIVINPIILAEVSVGFENLSAVDGLLRKMDVHRQPLPWEAAYRAGKAQAAYRRRGGQRDRTLPDFLIGAHAAVEGHRLLTRDPRRYRAYFPDLELIAPDTHP